MKYLMNFFWENICMLIFFRTLHTFLEKKDVHFVEERCSSG